MVQFIVTYLPTTVIIVRRFFLQILILKIFSIMGNSVASITGGSILSSANVGNDKSTTSTGSRNNNSNNNTTMIYNNIYNCIISNEFVKS